MHYEIDLSPQDWTDIRLPFHFNMRIADILEASRDSGFIQVYTWEKDSVSRKFITHGLFVPGLPDKEDRNTVLDQMGGNGFSIYNSSLKTITLKIPPVPIAMSQERALAKAKNTQQWSVKVISSTIDGLVLPEVYCGYSPGNVLSNYPAAPSFLSSRVMIFDRSTNRRYGHFIAGEFDGCLAKEIVFVNDGPKPVNYKYTLEKAGSFPSGIAPSILNPFSSKWENSGSVTVEAKSVEYRWLVASDENYKKEFINKNLNFKYSLSTIFPNPFRSAVNIKFTVPLGAKDNIRFTIHDALGRKLWEKTIDGVLNSGEHVLNWNGLDSRSKQVQAGTYFLSLTVINSHGKNSKVFNSRLTFLP